MVDSCSPVGLSFLGVPVWEFSLALLAIAHSSSKCPSSLFFSHLRVLRSVFHVRQQWEASGGSGDRQQLALVLFLPSLLPASSWESSSGNFHSESSSPVLNSSIFLYRPGNLRKLLLWIVLLKQIGDRKKNGEGRRQGRDLWTLLIFRVEEVC